MAKIESAAASARPAGPRTAPHNLQAEESLLGAMLLARDAIAAAAEVVQPEHFYKPAHSHIYDAILSLYGAGEPVDAITVADELARAGLLDTVGGAAALIGVQANAPAISNAGRYARIIEELALLRGMIGVAGEIAELGYSMPDDVAKAVDTAEAMVFDLAQHRQAGTTATIRQLLEQSLDRLEQLYERGEAITGTPTGYLDLDELLSGLQPNALVVVGARPAMGKALALDTPVPTPAGWTTMGELRPGEEVLDDQGRPCRVTVVTPVQHGRECFRITLDDGTSVVADADHRWLVYDGAPSPAEDLAGSARVMTTREMLASGPFSGRAARWYLPVTAALALPQVDLPHEPYRLGRALAAEHRPEAHAETLPAVIPAAYLRASRRQRAALLRGLLDGCGATLGETVHSHGGTVALGFAQRQLGVQARELVCSLGYAPGPLRRTERLVHPNHCAHALFTRTVDPGGDRIEGLPVGSTNGCCDGWWFSWQQPSDAAGRDRDRDLPVVVSSTVGTGFSRPTDSSTECDRRVTQGIGGVPHPGPRARPVLRAVMSIVPTASVPVRCISVDSPSHLYLVGDSMIATHNTSFALGMAANAALAGQRPVLFFSLEMSQIEITQRLLCSEARVDATRVRNGRLNEGDWEKISHTVGRLAEAPIWIDDNPNLTVMEIRSKARKLKSQVGDLGLVVVDYIQLMTGRTAAESRQVEVAEISRGLKILAREIETPVVALAQLNRGLEQRADKRPMLSDLRESGCLPASTRLMRADNGEEVTIGELVRSQHQPLVWSVDEHQRLVPARLVKAFPSGIKPVFRLRLASGRTVDATANHPFLTVDGWTRLDALAPGSFVAAPRRLPAPVEDQPDVWSDDELLLLAHGLRSRSMAPSVTSARAERANPLARGAHQPLRNRPAPLTPDGSTAATAYVPQSIFGLPDHRIALFLQHLWAAEGSLDVGRNASGSLAGTRYSSASRRLALDLQRLLLRLAIRSTIVVGEERCVDGSCQPTYSVCIRGDMEQDEFRRALGGSKADGCTSDALAIAGTLGEQPVLEERPVVHLDVDAPAGDLARPADLDWDQVLEITPLGEQPTFDATIEGTHNFIADGIVVHNSLEQDADVVMFLYRDEIYNRESPDQGIAEVIVAKHRSGPTGAVRLAFLGQYTKFVNMARG